MFGLSMTEVVIILGLALLLLGPDQLPSIAKTLGKGMREIRKATDD
ncbi:MAG TPA: twin-arginine translocase TatA/TatE family subunit, partial [Myxococcales bacterium]